MSWRGLAGFVSMGVLKPLPGGRKVSSVLGGVLLAASMWFDERLATYAMADMRLCCVALFVPRRGVASAGGARRGRRGCQAPSQVRPGGYGLTVRGPGAGSPVPTGARQA